MTGGTPESGTLPDTQVRAMFDRIARVYDRMNSVMTAGMHHRWRERAADLAQVGPGSRALDVATGTGDLAIELARRGAEVTGIDFAPAMLEIAREKAPGLTFEEGDALAPRPPGRLFDAVTVGFGARNFADLDRGLGEMARVTKPGGRVVVLEITTPQKPPLSWFFRAWFDTVVPALGRLRRRPGRVHLPAEQRAALPRPGGAGRAAWPPPGWSDVRWILTAGGIIAIHAGTRREHRAGTARRRARGRRAGARAPARAHRGSPRRGRGGSRRRARPPRGRHARRGRQAPAAVLVFLCGEATDERLVAAGAAVELLHMATLVHDDVLDAAELRRGRPTVFAEAGSPAATATGDLLFSRAFAELAATGSEDAVRALSTASSALARGELMQRADAWSEDVTPERYLERCRLKTASLFEASCRLGALFGGRPELAAALGALRRAARRGVPDARRRARRGRARRSAPASRAAPTCSTGP